MRQRSKRGYVLNSVPAESALDDCKLTLCFETSAGSTKPLPYTTLSFQDGFNEHISSLKATIDNAGALITSQTAPLYKLVILPDETLEGWKSSLASMSTDISQLGSQIDDALQLYQARGTSSYPSVDPFEELFANFKSSWPTSVHPMLLSSFRETSRSLVQAKCALTTFSTTDATKNERILAVLEKEDILLAFSTRDMLQTLKFALN